MTTLDSRKLGGSPLLWFFKTTTTMAEWIKFSEQTPKVGQHIEVHTYSDLYLDTYYDRLRDLEGICSEWRPVDD